MMNAYSIIASIGIIFLVTYFSLPTYTIGESENKIHQEYAGIVALERLDNTAMDKETFDLFGSKWFYTFRATENSGYEYVIIFNPNSGKSFEKN